MSTGQTYVRSSYSALEMENLRCCWGLPVAIHSFKRLNLEGSTRPSVGSTPGRLILLIKCMVGGSYGYLSLQYSFKL